MKELKCSICGAVTIKLASDSLYKTGTITICNDCNMNDIDNDGCDMFNDNGTLERLKNIMGIKDFL